MNIGYISSNDFAPYTGTSMYSLFAKNKKIKTIRVFIIDDGISNDNKEKIKWIAQKFKREVHFLNAKKVICELKEKYDFAPSEHRAFPNSIYAISFPELFFDNCIEKLDRILLIDSDMIINHDLSELYDTNITNVYLAAVPEMTAYYSSSEYRDVIQKNKYYYNCGLTLWNLNKVRKDNFTQKVFDTYKTFERPLKLASQSLVNMSITDEDVISLHMKYNYNSGLHMQPFRRPIIYKRYAEEGLGYPCSNYNKKLPAHKIYVIHFLGPRKPWIKWCFPPFAGHFMMYWRRTQWRKMPRESYLDRIIQNKLEKNPNAFVGKGYIGRIYAILFSILERFCPKLLKKLKEAKKRITA